MTNDTKNQILSLRNEEYGYKEIAKELNVVLSTVKYICSNSTTMKLKVLVLIVGSRPFHILTKRQRSSAATNADGTIGTRKEERQSIMMSPSELK